MKKNFFLTMEGIDGVGKSIQAKLLCEYLENKGLSVVATREPGGDLVSEKIRDIILDPKQQISAITELMLYEASRAEHFFKVISPALKSNKVVVCERFTDSTLVYQGYVRGIDLKTIQNLNSIVTNGIKPDLTILFDLEPQTSYKRLNLAKAGKLDRIESEGIEFQKKLRQAYFKIAANDNRFKVIKVDNKTIQEVHQELIVEIIKNKLC